MDTQELSAYVDQVVEAYVVRGIITKEEGYGVCEDIYEAISEYDDLDVAEVNQMVDRNVKYRIGMRTA